MASGNETGKNVFTSIFYASFVKGMSLEPFIALFTQTQSVHAELAGEPVFIFTVDFLELWKLNFFNSICFPIVVTHCVMKFYGEVKHLPWRVPASVELDGTAWIGHTSHSVTEESCFQRAWKRTLGVYTVTQIERSCLSSCFLLSQCYKKPLRYYHH